MGIFPAEMAAHAAVMQQSDLRSILSGSAMNMLMALRKCNMLDNNIQVCKIHI